MRAIARRAVMKLSWKWRSGRAELRVVSWRPSGRGGKMPHALSDDERVAAQSDRHMMMPTRIPAALKVIEAEFPFEVFVHALRAPALHHGTNQLLLGHRPRKR